MKQEHRKGMKVFLPVLVALLLIAPRVEGFVSEERQTQMNRNLQSMIYNLRVSPCSTNGQLIEETRSGTSTWFLTCENCAGLEAERFLSPNDIIALEIIKARSGRNVVSVQEFLKEIGECR